jgi:hypothetical protein
MHNFTPKGWRHIQLYKNIYKLNNVHKLNKQRHSNNIQIKWKKFRLVIYSLRNTERVPFGTTQTRRSLRKGLENIKAHLKLIFVRDKYITFKREYIKSLNGRSNVQLMVAKYGVQLQIYTNYYGILKTPINYRNNLNIRVPNSTSMSFQNTVFHGSTYTSTLYQIRVPDGGSP